MEIPSNPVIDFPTQTVDLTQGDIILDIIHHNPLEVEFSGFPDLQSSCQIPIMQQGESYEINISVFERYGDYNCPLDYGVLTIYDDISDINDPIEIIVENGSASYTIITGEPNILSGGLHPYEKQLEVEINNESVIHDQWVYVEGHKPRTETFTTVSPELPFFILRDPPGDESYSYLSNSTTSCIAVSMAFEAEGAVGIFINAKYGLEFSVGFAGISGNVGAGIEIDGSVEVGGGLNLQEETEVCISTQTVFSTSDQQEITGPEGDVYGGAAINLIYAITDVLEINDNCEVEINQNIAWNGDGFSTQYLYTDGHIRNVLIPQLNQTGQTDAAVLWQDILDLNDLLKQQAVFEINRSFVAGATTEYSESFTLTESRYIEYYTFIDADVAVQAGIEVFGTGVSGGVKVRGRFQIGDALYSDYSITNSVGYSLQDDDPGDYFSVDVKNDNVFGTPVFELVSGASSCPWEHPTTPREGVEIHIDPHDMSNISPDDLASFNLDLGNISQTNEEREYHLSVIQESNPYGAIINVGGVIIEDYLSYTIPSGQQIPATLSVGIGPSMYDYENLQVELFSPCDHEQIADTATFSVSYIPPCTDVTIISPENNWILNQNNNDTLQIIVSDYDLTDVNLLRLKLQFSNSGDNDWIDIESLEVADIIDNYQIIYWEVTHLSDGEYDIRAIVVCTNGENYSDVLTGIIDRNSPELFGLPQPSDGILEAGDEISSNFTETIDCNLVNSSNVSLITEDGLIISNFAVQCNGSSIIIVLQVDNYIIENKILTATLSGISDNNGNIITEDICWSFFVNRNPVYWSPPNITQLTNEGTGFSISAMLLNNGSQEESFLITNYADWITPTTTNGLIPVLGQSSVDFVISDQLGIGTHIDTLYADTDMGDEPLLIIINVYPVIPWNVNPSDYQYNMALTGIIQFDGVPSTDSLDLVAAFVNDECRGIASPHQFGDNGDYPFGMTIFSNQVTGEIIHFKAYDYSENLMYHNIEETFGFTSDAVLGNLSSPEILNAISSYALEIPMTGNWNWFSFNVVLDDMSTNNILASIGDNGLFIKNQSSFAEYYPGNGWISLNGLNVLENTSGYKIKMANPDTLIITGIPLDVFNTPIYLDSNWNWIGYLPQNAIEINEALVSIENNGLFIKDQSSFAEYYTGNGWISLNGLGILEPGNGYMLKMGSDDTLWYQPGNDDVRLAQVKQLNAQYNHEPGNYADNMCVTSEMRIQGIDCIDTNFILLAYSNDECRGVSKLTYVPVLDRYLFGLTISGNNQDQLTFKVMNSVNDEWYDIDYNLEFISNKVIGSCLNPLILLISPLGIDNQPAVPEKFTVSQNFPNPFNSVTKIDFGLSSNGQTKITIYNVVGQEIKTLINRELKPGWHSVSWMGHDNSGNSVPSGIYIYRVESGISNDTKKMILIK